MVAENFQANLGLQLLKNEIRILYQENNLQFKLLQRGVEFSIKKNLGIIKYTYLPLLHRLKQTLRWDL